MVVGPHVAFDRRVVDELERLPRPAIHEVHRRRAPAVEALGRGVADEVPAVYAAVRMQAGHRPLDALQLGGLHIRAPGLLVPDRPCVHAIGIPPFVAANRGVLEDWARGFAAADGPHAVGDRCPQAGMQVGVALLGEQHHVRVHGTELGMVVVAVETVPELEIPAVQGERAEHEFCPPRNPHVHKELAAIGGAAQVGGQPCHAAVSQHIRRQGVDAFCLGFRLRPPPPDRCPGRPVDLPAVGIHERRRSLELRIGEAVNGLCFGVHHCQRPSVRCPSPRAGRRSRTRGNARPGSGRH